MGGGFVRVFSTLSWTEGEIVKGRLEAEGIPVVLEGEHEGPYPVGPAELSVPSSFESQARRILEQIERGSFEVPGEDDPGRAPEGEPTE
jgi:Putative prokaryotic signal transducing protein